MNSGQSSALGEVAASLLHAQEQFAILAQDGAGEVDSLKEMRRLQQRIQTLAFRQMELLHAAHTTWMAHLHEPGSAAPAERKTRRSGRPMREQVLDILNDIAAPAPPRAISDYALACFGTTIPSARLASLRRDEYAAYENNPGSRPAWVVPSLSVMGFTPIPRFLVNSAWPPEDRLVGVRTTRVALLRLVIALARHWETASDQGTLRQILAHYAATIAGALPRGAEPEPGRISETADDELRALEEADLAERRGAAADLAALPQSQQIWGRAPLALVAERSAQGA